MLYLQDLEIYHWCYMRIGRIINLYSSLDETPFWWLHYKYYIFYLLYNNYVKYM